MIININDHMLVIACRSETLQGRCRFTNKSKTCKQSTIYFPEIIRLYSIYPTSSTIYLHSHGHTCILQMVNKLRKINLLFLLKCSLFTCVSLISKSAFASYCLLYELINVFKSVNGCLKTFIPDILI